MSDAELRRTIAAEHGLGPEAAALLTGETVEELDGSARALAQLIAERREEPEPEPVPGQGFFAGAAAAKAERRQALVDALTGRSEQRRDERGRFSGGFDGGARAPAPQPREGHDAWLGRLLRTRAADTGARF
jgi:hypothetical protein